MRWMLLGITVITAALWLACSGDDDKEDSAPSGTAGGAAVQIVLDEWSIAMEGSARTGAVIFEVENKGSAIHELVILKTDLAADALPVDGGKVDEDAAELEVIGEVEEFPSGQAEVGTFELDSGRYVLICNIPAHYEQGMYAEMAVQ